ncbi:methoxymalonate biosynthesis protein [Prauserella aidingensis]|nr:acyl-CoA dehydrogenase family protein [Prauserella aidingensis]MCP2251345.1 methoxymalonate biosynthesis protein [Prauserella aidingensis]
MADPAAAVLADESIGEAAGEWDAAGVVPDDVVRTFASRGLLCAQVPTRYGGLGMSSHEGGEFTAYVGSRCSSLRSIMTSQGMAAWTIQRTGDRRQRAELLGRLTSGETAAVAFSERNAGSDLSAMATTIELDGDTVVVTGEKVWITAATYADVIVVFGLFDDGMGAVVVPATAPGVSVERIAEPLGCAAAGHAVVRLDRVRVPARALLGGGGQAPSLLTAYALASGRMSVAWGCVGILRGCLAAVSDHVRQREQGGAVLAEHQLVARHVARLHVAERTATRMCAHASECWDAGSPDAVSATVLAKYVSARGAADGASDAVQLLASAGAGSHHVVSRAYRDAKLMEIIEGSNEICELLLAEHALAGSARPAGATGVSV